MRLLLAAIALFGLAAPGHAEQCDSPQSQTEMNTCANYRFEKADAELNSAYVELMSGYKSLDVLMKKDNPSGELAAPALLNSQRAWIKMRDAECHLEGLGSQGGSMRPMIINGCMERLTLDRISWLRKRLSCDEGDLNCLQLTDAAD